MKKIVSFLVILMMLCTSIPFITAADTETEPTVSLSDLEFKNYGGYYGVESCNPEAVGVVYIPERYGGGPIQYIEPGAFKDCTGITKVITTQVIETIGEEAFAGCTNLESIEMFYNVRSIADNAFDNCPKLTMLVLEEDNKGNEHYSLTYAKSHNIPYEIIVHNYYTITFDTGLFDLAGEPLYEKTTALEGMEVSLTASSDKKDGYDFWGWTDGTSEWQSGTVIRMFSKDVTLTPVFRKIWILKYVPGVDDFVGQSQRFYDKSYGTSLELQASTAFSRPGYSLIGWLCDVDGVEYGTNNSYVMPDSDVIMTAIWAPNTYSFIFALDTGRNPTTFREPGTYGEDLIIPECPFEKEGYHFIGWKYGSTTDIYQPGDVFTIPALLTGSSVSRFLAQWEEGGAVVTGSETTAAETTTSETTASETTASETTAAETTAGNTNTVYGDVNDDGKIGQLSDVVVLGKFLGNKADLDDQAKSNANVHNDTGLTSNDLIVLVKLSFGEINLSDLPVKA